MESYSTYLDQPPTKYIIKDQIGFLTIDDLFGFGASYLDSTHMAVILSIIFPELKIENDTFENIEKDKITTDIIKVLDSDQEKFAKRIPYGHYLLSGIPGSGKTVILLSRAIFLLNTDFRRPLNHHN